MVREREAHMASGRDDARGRPARRGWHALRLGVLALSLIGGSAFAQTVDPPARYTIRVGDTLLGLARVYMTKVADYQAVQQLNHVRDPRHLPVGDTLLVPVALLRTEPILGEIAAFRGTVTVDSRPATVGMKVSQGMRIETGASAFVTVKLPDASAISLPSQSRIRIEKLRRILLTGSVERTFLLEAGRSRSTVTPFRDPASNFRVTTPLSVSAVRGTDFRVAFDPDGKRALTEVVGGTVGVAPDAARQETSVPKAYGIVGTPAGLEEPVALLPPPELVKIARTASGTVAVSIKPLDGAKGYRIQLASDAAFQDIFTETITDKPDADLTLPANATFYLRLTALAVSGLEGMPMTYGSGRSRLDGGAAAGTGAAQ